MQNVYLPPEVEPTFLALHAAASPRLAAWMEEHVAQLSARIRTSWRVPVTRTGERSGIFRGPLRLYRLLDSFERDVLADAFAADPDATFSGGTYNTDDERVGGAAFGALPLDVLGFERRGGRLKPPLYLVEIEANGLPFVHLTLDRITDGEDVYALGGSTGLGFNVRPRVRSVLRAWAVNPDTRATQPVAWLDLLAKHRTGRTAATLAAIRDYERATDYFYELINKARRDGDDRRFWTAWRKDEARAELGIWAEAIAKVEAVLPGFTGLDTYGFNIIDRLPADLKRAFAQALAAARRRTSTPAPRPTAAAESLARTHTFGPYRVIPEPHDDGGSILNWSVEADLYDAEEKQKIAFSASLTFALADRAFADPWERPIPESTMAKLESLAVRLSAAGLF